MAASWSHGQQDTAILTETVFFQSEDQHRTEVADQNTNSFRPTQNYSYKFVLGLRYFEFEKSRDPSVFFLRSKDRLVQSCLYILDVFFSMNY